MLENNVIYKVNSKEVSCEVYQQTIEKERSCKKFRECNLKHSNKLRKDDRGKIVGRNTIYNYVTSND